MYFIPLASAAVALIALIATYIVYQVFIAPRFNPLRNLCGPPVRGLWGSHMSGVLE
jgi:hypothetical protein